MAFRDRPAWPGWIPDKAVRYLWRPRHGQDGEPRRVSWMEIALVSAVVLVIAIAAFAGSRNGSDDPARTKVVLPTLAPAAPGGYPSAAVPIPLVPVPSGSPAAPTPLSPAARPATTTARPAPHPPAARTKAPVFTEKVIAATSVLTTGQSWSTNRLRLTVTTSGNLVLQDQGRTVWQTGTTTGVKLVMQNDGHLVLYDTNNGTVFSSGTAGNPGAVLILRADGNMVISLNGRILFQTGTGD
jgi:hypothetical protein